MRPDKTTLLFAIFLIVMGTGWLLTNLGFVPEINWLWTIGLAAIGVLAFWLSGFNKFSFVIGTFFIVASILSGLRQMAIVTTDIEVPVMVIISGLLLLIARLPLIPAPHWFSKPQ